MVAGVYGEIAADGKSIVLAVAGDDWEIDGAASALKRMTPLLKRTEPRTGMLVCPLTWPAVTQLGHTFGSDMTGRWLPGPRLQDWITAEFERRCVPTIMRAPVPDGLVPRPYQEEGAQQIASSGAGFLLFDDPGTGKTVTTLLGLKIRALLGQDIFPMVIVVPSWDVADVWARHLRTWAPGWPAAIMYGGAGRTLARPEKRGIYITTYATARLDAASAQGPLVKLKPAALVCDEAHAIKNVDSKQSQAVRRIAAKAFFLGLSGTPVTRDTGDIFPALVAMDSLSYPSRKRFVKRYLDTAEDDYGESIEGLKAAAEPEFRTVLAGQHRRVAKADVLDQLPPKIYSVRRIDIPPEWRKAYDGMAEEMLAELPDGGDLPVMSVLAQLTRLSQLSAAACDVAVTEDIDTATGELLRHYEVTMKAPSWKVDALKGILAERPDQQTAVFANSRQLIMLAAGALTGEGRSYGLITGGQSKTSRRADIDAFQRGELDVILCTAGAGSLGITLTAAGTAVFLQRSWELDKAIQPEDRLHRIGQAHDAVEIIDVVAKDTVDDRVRELMRVKGARLGQLVQDSRVVRALLGGIK